MGYADMDIKDCYTDETKARIMDAKAHRAVVRFLMNKGYAIEAEDTNFDIVAEDEDGTYVFIDIFVKDACDEPAFDRHDMEVRVLDDMVRYCGTPDTCRLRYDRITVVPMGDRALLKHHINVGGSV